MPPAVDPLFRSRIPTSCAECRRLKLKCDKMKPCSSCRRRGCASICPQGQMVAKGTRFILASTEQLHEKIDELISRVHQLEDALEMSHSLHSNEPHPLLREELRPIAMPVDTALPIPEIAVREEDLSDSIGILSLDGHGSRYFGSTGAFAYLWNDGDGPGPEVKSKGEASLALSQLPPELAHMAHAFPILLPAGDTTHLGAWILEYCLPPFTEAWSLFENYWEHYAWHFTPFTRAGFVEQILSPLYHRSPDHGDKPLGHRLGLLFMVFAIGEFMDLTQPLGPSNGFRYYLLARASLCLDPVFESPTVTALQAMYLMSVYLLMARGVYQPEHAWILSGVNTKLALTLGLQHDANKFNLATVEVEARQHVLVAILCQEIWQALSVGRPASCSVADFDWVFSKEPEIPTPGSSMSSRDWSANFIRSCVSKVLEAVVHSKVTSYSTIMKLDAKIREYPVLVQASDVTEDIAEEQGPRRTMQRTLTAILKELCLLFLHRRFFAIALRDAPNDPLKSPFAPSVLACYRSAATYVSRISAVHSAMPAITLRIAFMWPNIFVATLVLGSIVAGSPGCSLAASALQEFEMACQLWETSSDNVCGPKVLATVRQLKYKAFAAFAHDRAPKDPLGSSPGGVEVSDEIHALGGGGPRVMSSTVRPPPPPHAPERTVSFMPSQTPPPISASEDYAVTPSRQHVHDSGSLPFPGGFPDLSPSSMAPSFNFTNVDFSSYSPEFAADKLPGDFDEIFQAMTATATQTAPVGSILEELGLGGEWQPVMDDLGL